MRWLKWKAAKSSSSKFITSLRKTDGSTVSQSQHILEEFTDFYRNLYSSSNPSSQAISSYLNSTNFSVQLSSAHKDFLDSPITSTEVLGAIRSLKPGKAPGRDGLPAEFYKRFGDLLMEPLLDLGTDLYSNGAMPKSWAVTRIIVIPKKDRDPARVGSYRPISLINHDMKIFTSIMARRLNSFIASYVHIDQSGFIPSRQISDNIRKTLNVIHHCVLHRIPSLIVALDAEKAFDKLEISYLQSLLQRMNFGPHFLRAIRTLYAHPLTQLSVNRFRSDDFCLTRGTRQGCPLSPILFAISLESLAAAIRSDPHILGIDINSHTYKLNLFADELLFFLKTQNYHFLL